MKTRFVLVALLAACLGVFGYYLWGERHTPSGQPPLTTLDTSNLDNLRIEFNAHADKVRIIILLSPT